MHTGGRRKGNEDKGYRTMPLIKVLSFAHCVRCYTLLYDPLAKALSLVRRMSGNPAAAFLSARMSAAIVAPFGVFAKLSSVAQAAMTVIADRATSKAPSASTSSRCSEIPESDKLKIVHHVLHEQF